VYSINVKQPAHELILAPARGCKPQASFPEATKHFEVDRCIASHPMDEYDFVQVKPTSSGFHVYCPQSNMTIDGRTLPCPDSVFLLPLNTNFSINEHDFVTSSLNIHHQEIHDPLFTLKANWHINPTVNWSSFTVPERKYTKTTKSTPDSDLTHHISMWSIAGCLLIILVLTGAVIYLVRKKNGPMQITLQPVPRDDPDTVPAATS
jgi:hypothetical protein